MRSLPVRPTTSTCIRPHLSRRRTTLLCCRVSPASDSNSESITTTDSLVKKTTFKLRLLANFKLDLSLAMNRKSFSALLIVTAMYFVAPPALAKPEENLPEYGPGLPRRDILFTDGVFFARVHRRATAQLSKFLETEQAYIDDYPEEILEVSMEVPRSQVTSFDLFLNFPEASEDSSVLLPQYVGSCGTHEGDRPGNKVMKVRFGITDKIRMFKLEHEPSVLVAMVRKGSKDAPVTIKDMDIALEY